MRLTTDVELADLLGITVDDVRMKCRPGGGWPCVKPKRSVWRFTDAMVEEIIAKQTVTPARSAQVVSARSARGRRAS
ncbi:hypothetical protein CFH99_07975 [Nocardioides aromaticivorans]|uniref:DNA-binding protein n=1 Tax=Nocardioides aromaticivorans TaxID=200618 RepID=A0ABX7PI34_9ACTN|nr:hypothetical protein [Nocardioides aromaticivorans]QSR25559.1 hypothetical protein CFH99_07975 [Nocardioides aromaticivorans]